MMMKMDNKNNNNNNNNNNSGEFFCINSSIKYLREAMPFDQVRSNIDIDID